MILTYNVACGTEMEYIDGGLERTTDYEEVDYEVEPKIDEIVEFLVSLSTDNKTGHFEKLAIYWAIRKLWSTGLFTIDEIEDDPDFQEYMKDQRADEFYEWYKEE